MNKPNLFLIGTQKGGTTSLFGYLVQHPDITALGGSKEPNVFCVRTEKECTKKLSAISVIKDTSLYCIDASVNYSRYPRFSTSARNIRNICGTEDTKFIYIIRNPVNRLISNYFWNVERFGESRPLISAIQYEEQYVKTSLYDLQIMHYLQHFDIIQFYFLIFEDFIKAPIQEVNQIINWLELDKMSHYTNQGSRSATNKDYTRTAKFPALNKLLWSYYPIRSVVNRAFSPKTINKVNKMLTKRQKRPIISIDTKRNLLEKYFKESINETSKITGLNLNRWLDDF